MKRFALAAVAALLATPVPAHAGGGGCYDGLPAVATAATTVVVEHACFGPTAARVQVGATVTWRNQSGLHHNISGPAIELAELPDGGTVTWSFTAPGLYPYACMIHPGMSGVVQVVAADAAVAVPAPATSSGGGVPIGAVGAGAGIVAAAGLLLVARRRSPLPA